MVGGRLLENIIRNNIASLWDSAENFKRTITQRWKDGGEWKL